MPTKNKAKTKETRECFEEFIKYEIFVPIASKEGVNFIINRSVSESAKITLPMIIANIIKKVERILYSLLNNLIVIINIEA